MKKSGIVFLIVGLASFLMQCEKDEDTDLLGDWIKVSYFEGIPRSNAVSFVIDGKAYVGAGYDGSDYLTDFWMYDPELDFWLRIADFPGDARTDAVGFSIGSKGYVGTGYNGEEKLKDFWEYDPASDSWERKADFGGTARYSAIGFSIGDLGYIGTGYDGYELKDFWAYDPELDSWTQKVSLRGSKRRDAIAFTLNGKGYVCTGRSNGVLNDELWEYVPEEDRWYEMEELDAEDEYAIIRANAVAFTLNGRAYVATGEKGSIVKDVWEYDPESDTWEEKTGFEGSARMEAVAFALGNKGYLTTGRSSSYRFDDIWEFDPLLEYDEDD